MLLQGITRILRRAKAILRCWVVADVGVGVVQVLKMFFHENMDRNFEYWACNNDKSKRALLSV